MSDFVYMFGRSVFAKEADALLAIRPVYSEPPPELKCPLCSNIFKDAVMIPCCQYSFCDKCKIHIYPFNLYHLGTFLQWRT